MAGYLSYMASLAENEFVLREVKDKAAYYTDEKWQYYVFESLKDVQHFMEQKPLLHISRFPQKRFRGHWMRCFRNLKRNLEKRKMEIFFT